VADSRPRLLDLFCGAGGCAVGYHRAGFNVTGVDLAPQPRYPFDFFRAGALEFLRCLVEADSNDPDALNATGGLCLSDFAAVHASPPCQAYSKARFTPGAAGKNYPSFLARTRRSLEGCGLPWVIENVEGSPLRGILLCGSMFGLPLRRHRIFEASFLLLAPPRPCRHSEGDLGVYGGKITRLGTRAAPYLASSGRTHYRPELATRAEGQRAMGIDWMSSDELSEAMPPAYTQWVGRQLRLVLGLDPVAEESPHA
jgi:DNA (cytosine-5)-methyltransferase 1